MDLPRLGNIEVKTYEPSPRVMAGRIPERMVIPRGGEERSIEEGDYVVRVGVGAWRIVPGEVFEALMREYVPPPPA